MKLFNKETKEFWKQLGMKTFAMFGFTYFSVAVALGSWTLITPSLLSAGLYFFSELIKYYKLQPTKEVLPNRSKRKTNGKYYFLI